MIKEAERISIIGGAGTGKTTLANNLGERLMLPVFHIDGINYFKDWKERNKDQRDKIILEKTNEKQWIIDGTYSSTLKQRLDKSDLIIYLDYSSLTQIQGVITRFIKNPGKEKKEIKGCKERLDWNFLIWVAKWRKNKRAEILEIIKEIDSNKLFIFKNRKQLNKWYFKQFNQKIKFE